MSAQPCGGIAAQQRAFSPSSLPGLTRQSIHPQPHAVIPGPKQMDPRVKPWVKPAGDASRSAPLRAVLVIARNACSIEAAPACSISFAGVVSANTLPRCRTTTRSASGTSSHRCVAHSTATERSARIVRMSLRRSLRLCGSRPTVASSMSRSRGSCSSARASSTRRRLPPESCAVLSCARSISPRRASSFSMRGRATARLIPCRPALDMRLPVTVSSRSRVGCWNTMPSCASAGTGSRAMSWPITSMRPSWRRTGRRAAGTAWSCRRRWARAAQSTNSPALASRLTPSTARMAP